MWADYVAECLCWGIPLLMWCTHYVTVAHVYYDRTLSGQGFEVKHMKTIHLQQKKSTGSLWYLFMCGYFFKAPLQPVLACHISHANENNCFLSVLCQARTKIEKIINRKFILIAFEYCNSFLTDVSSGDGDAWHGKSFRDPVNSVWSVLHCLNTLQLHGNSGRGTTNTLLGCIRSCCTAYHWVGTRNCRCLMLAPTDTSGKTIDAMDWKLVLFMWTWHYGRYLLLCIAYMAI